MAKESLSDKGAKVASVVAQLKSIADYRTFKGDVKAQKSQGKPYGANTAEAKQIYYSRRYNSFKARIAKNESDEKNDKALAELKSFVNSNKTIESQRGAAQATLDAVWKIYMGERSGTRGPSNTPLTMADF
jgi:hypothetical protein